MKARLSFPSVIAVGLFGAILSACASRTSYVDLYGMPAPDTAVPNRTIRITPNTRHVNVEGGQIVRFIVGGKAFNWNFYTARSVSSFDLNDVAPAGMLDHPVRAYVSPDPRYIGGDGERDR